MNKKHTLNLFACALISFASLSATKLNINKQLILAARTGNGPEVKRLLQNKASIYAIDELERTPLMFAVLEGHIEIVKELLSISDKDYINAKNRFGRNPLMLAAKNNRTLIAEELLAHGANPNIEDNNGRTAYDLATPEVKNVIEEFMTQNNSKDNTGDNS